MTGRRSRERKASNVGICWSEYRPGVFRLRTDAAVSRIERLRVVFMSQRLPHADRESGDMRTDGYGR